MFKLACSIIISITSLLAGTASEPKPPGKLVDLGGHRLHVNCTGKGSPTVVVENGLGDFSFDWVLVQSRVSAFTRICTYDRGGYAWSDPGPKPRTFAQLNLELRDALRKLGEPGPFVLVGHSYGGAVVRNFALTYRGDVPELSWWTRLSRGCGLVSAAKRPSGWARTPKDCRSRRRTSR
jgi:pimeloyl-ACP methyl ester carboxylesterase